jgi:hypothetical protein
LQAFYKTYPLQPVIQPCTGIVVIRRVGMVHGMYYWYEVLLAAPYKSKKERQHLVTKLSILKKVDNKKILLSIIPDVK